jgi:hypothetical protein
MPLRNQISITHANRTRLKVTVATMVIVALGLLWSAYQTYIEVHSNGAWTAFGLCVTAIVSAAGLYVNYETRRGSLVTNTFFPTINQYKELNGEDESDPETMPF